MPASSPLAGRRRARPAIRAGDKRRNEERRTRQRITPDAARHALVVRQAEAPGAGSPRSSTKRTSSPWPWSRSCSDRKSACTCCSFPRNWAAWAARRYDVYRVSEDMARLDLGVATAFLAIFLGTDPIVVGATEEQRKHWLRRIAEEGLIVAYAVTEPLAGSELSAIRTKAERVLENGGAQGLQDQRHQAVHLERRLRPALLGAGRRPGRAQLLPGREGHAGARAGQAREQARHPLVEHLAGDLRGRLRARGEPASAASRARAWSTRSRSSASPA